MQQHSTELPGRWSRRCGGRTIRCLHSLQLSLYSLCILSYAWHVVPHSIVLPIDEHDRHQSGFKCLTVVNWILMVLLGCGPHLLKNWLISSGDHWYNRYMMINRIGRQMQIVYKEFWQMCWVYSKLIVRLFFSVLRGRCLFVSVCHVTHSRAYGKWEQSALIYLTT